MACIVDSIMSDIHPQVAGILAASNGNLWRMPQDPSIPRKFGSRAFAKSQWPVMQQDCSGVCRFGCTQPMSALAKWTRAYATSILAASNGNLWRMPQDPSIPRKFGSRAFAKSQWPVMQQDCSGVCRFGCTQPMFALAKLTRPVLFLVVLKLSIFLGHPGFTDTHFCRVFFWLQKNADYSPQGCRLCFADSVGSLRRLVLR